MDKDGKYQYVTVFTHVISTDVESTADAIGEAVNNLIKTIPWTKAVALDIPI